MKKWIFPLILINLVACSEQPTTSQSTNNDIPNTPQTSQIEWYQDNLTTPIKMVGVSDEKQLLHVLKDVGLVPKTIEKSTDIKGEPKHIYQFADIQSLPAQLEYSPNRINLLWYQATDNNATIEKSQQSLKDIYFVARALFGKDGADAVRRVSNGGNFKEDEDVFQQYKINGSCITYVCSLYIHITP